MQMLEAVLNVCNLNARIPACGMISQYNVPDKEGVRNLFAVGPGLPTLHTVQIDSQPSLFTAVGCDFV